MVFYELGFVFQCPRVQACVCEKGDRGAPGNPVSEHYDSEVMICVFSE